MRLFPSPSTTGLAAALLSCAALVGCVSSEDAPAPTTTTPSAGVFAGVPNLNPSQRGDLQRRLQAIDKNLVLDLDLAVTRSRFVCKQIVEGTLTPAQLTAFTTQQFMGGAVTAITPAGADAIVAAVQAAFCPSPAPLPSSVVSTAPSPVPSASAS